MRKLKILEKISYGFGDLGNNVTFMSMAIFLLMFYTNYLKISPIDAGIIFFVARIWDAFADITIGVIIDRRVQHPKYGKFRIFLLKASWPVLIMFILCFTAPHWSYTYRLLWAYITYIGWGTAYSLINIPYGSLASVMTNQVGDRAALSVARSLGSSIGGTLPQILIIPIVLMFHSTTLGWVVATLLLSIIAGLSYLCAYKGTVEQVKSENPKEKISIKDLLEIFKTNRPFWGVSIGSIAIVITFMLNGTLALYYFKYDLHAEKFYGYNGLIGLVITLILATVLVSFVKKKGARKLAIMGSLFCALAYAIILVLPSNIYLYLILFFVATFAYSLPNMLVWMMLSDSIEYAEWRTGKRNESVIYAAYSFMRKISQALAGLISGLGLGLIGYHVGEQMSGHVLQGIKFMTVGIPVIGMIVAAMAFLFIYNLTPNLYKKILIELDQRRLEV